MALNSRQKRMCRQIVEVAEPGDLLFYISNINPDTNKEEFNLARRLKRRLDGFDFADNSIFHVTMYAGPGKRGKVNLLESVTKEGVREWYISNNYMQQGSRLELARFTGAEMTPEKRERIIENAKSLVGTSFDVGATRGLPISRLLGLPNPFSDYGKLMCQDFVMLSYLFAGVKIIDKDIGAAIDHDLYRSPNLEVLIATEPEGKDFKVTLDPGKYSWDEKLREKYLPSNQDSVRERIETYARGLANPIQPRRLIF